MRRIFALISAVSLFACPVATAAAPHSHANTLNKVDNQSGAQTDKALWTPTSGTRIALMGCSISSLTAQTTAVKIGSTTVIPIQYTGSNGNVTISGGAVPIATGATDEALTYTTTAGVATSVVCWGYEWSG